MKITTRIGLLAAAAASACLSLPAHAAGEAKNVIFFLGDGMGPATVTASRIYKYGESGRLTMESLRRTARIKTFSNDAQTTDSAPSMAAYMTGVKMNNEVISMSEDTVAYAPNGTQYINGEDTTCTSTNGKPAVTLLELSKAAGRSVGAVSTTRVGHATPAATYSHICNRNGYNTIAEQSVPGHANYNAALGDGVDVLMGGGQRNYLPLAVNASSKRTDGVNLVTAMEAKGYKYVDTGTKLAALDATSTTKLLGLFSQSEMAYELDRVNQKLDQPSLSQMTEKALQVLSRNDKGFFLMVEGGRIDQAHHEGNAYRALNDTVELSNAVRAAAAKVDLDDTLIIVTADHSHTLTISGYPARGNNILGLVREIGPDGKLEADYKRDKLGLPFTTLNYVSGRGYTGATDVAAEGPKYWPGKPTKFQAIKKGRTDLTLIDTTVPNYDQEALFPLADETHGGEEIGRAHV